MKFRKIIQKSGGRRLLLLNCWLVKTSTASEREVQKGRESQRSETDGERLR